MSKIIRLTESDLIRLVKRVIKEQEGFDALDDDFGFESPLCPNCKGEGCVECDGSGMKRNSIFPDEDDEIEDYGFDVEDEFNDDDKFQNKMKFQSHMKKHKPGSIGIGAGTRWDKDSEKEWSPIKADDLPLDKFLKSKYKK